MTDPGVQGPREDHIELPSGESLDPHAIDLGMREYTTPSGDTHAVVTDVHPPSRFFPESLVAILRETIETDDEFEQFGTPHLMGIVMEEFPEQVVVHDAADDGAVGYAMVWITEFDARRLHEIVVELVVELMDHAISHADDDAAITEFESSLEKFDVEAFVDQYRREREFESEHDRAL